MPQHNTTVSLASPAAYEAARHHAAFLPRPDRGYLVVSGADRASFLHALITNDVAGLPAGGGCYAALLTPQGRMITDLWVHELGDAMLLRLGADACAALLAKLDALVFSEDVQLGDVTGAFQGVTVVGPEASAILCAVLGGEPLETLPEHGCRRTKYEGGAAVIVRADDLGVPGFELLVEATYASSLEAALRAGGAAPLDVGTAEVLRVEQGVPKFHQDMDEETIPLEAGIEQRAISLTKGCYVGQEVIIRVLHRGHGRVARRLVGLLCAGAAAPPPGAIVVEDGQQVGRVTSSARSPALGQPIVLAYVRRESAEEGRRVAIEPADREGDREGAGSVAGHGAVERIEATVAPLPFIHATP